MKIEDFIDRVLLIDNLEAEAKPLIDLFQGLDIDAVWFNPRGENKPKPCNKNRQLVFVDLMLDENLQLAKSSIAEVVKILSEVVTPSFGPYGLIVWTKHVNLIQDLYSYINASLYEGAKNNDEEDMLSQTSTRLAVPPMFVVPLDKSLYLGNGHDYNTLLHDIESALTGSNVGYFFMSWCASVRKATNKTISDIYGLCKDYPRHDSRIEYLLYVLAKNQTGAPEGCSINTADCYKAFDELLYADLFVKQNKEVLPDFSKVSGNPWDTVSYEKVCAALNTKMFLDFDCIEQNVIVPGNVYKLKGVALKYKVDDSEKYKYANGLYTAEDIAIELTPPCDFSNKKIKSRIVSGYLFKFAEGTKENIKKLNELKATLKHAEKHYVLKNILIDGSVQYLLFDYRHLNTPSDCDLKDSAKFEVYFRAKPKLFADILQKFSSHASRLGLSDIQNK